LPVGRYSVSTELKGFKKVVRTGLVLNVSDKLGVNLTLEAGAVTDTVTVEANALQVDTQSAAAAGVINGTQLRELSLNSRNYAHSFSSFPARRIPAMLIKSFPAQLLPSAQIS